MKVLVIDDDPMIVQMLQMGLDLEPGWSFDAVDTPEEGVQAAIDSRPDVILLDLMFPHADGRDVLRTLRDQPLTRDIPVVLCSGASDTDAQGADGFIEKPYNVMDLPRLVRKALHHRTT